MSPKKGLMTLNRYLTIIKGLLSGIEKVQIDIERAANNLKKRRKTDTAQILKWIDKELSLLEELDKGPLADFERLVNLVKRRPKIEAKYKGILDALRELQPTIKNIKKAVTGQKTALAKGKINTFLADYELQKKHEGRFIEKASKSGVKGISKMRRMATGFVMAAIMLISQGCAIIQQTRETKIEPTKVEKVEKVKNIYSSPVVKKSWGFRILFKIGDVDKTKLIYIKGDKLYLIGFSRVCAIEKTARRDAERQAVSKLANLTGQSRISILPTKANIIKVENKKGETGWVAEVLCWVSLSNFSKKIQKLIKEKVPVF
ncbi:MAG: hypothetical protein KAT77_01415 [Nanoarchaeota archaeon]|nr:hypothetical protein [Nanoarchaeota archaeon]